MTNTLKHLPKTLDATYVRILTDIDDEYREEAYNALQWLALAARPLYIEELIDASIIYPDRALAFKKSDRLQPADMINLLSHLITIDPPFDPSTGDISWGVHRVELSHFSVKEFLISSEIGHSDAARFSINPTKSHSFIAQSCLWYLDCCMQSPSTQRNYPLLNYSIYDWPLHAVADTADFVPDQEEMASVLSEDICYGGIPLDDIVVPSSIKEVIYSINLRVLGRGPRFRHNLGELWKWEESSSESFAGS